MPAVTPFVQELKYGVGRTTALGTKFETYSTDLQTALIQVLEGQKSAQQRVVSGAGVGQEHSRLPGLDVLAFSWFMQAGGLPVTGARRSLKTGPINT